MSDDIFTISPSKANAWAGCQFKYGISYILEMRPKERPSYLSLGSLIHKFVQEYYDNLSSENPVPPVDHLNDGIRREFQRAIENSWDTSLVAQAGKIIRRYIEDWAPYNDENFVTLDTEMQVEGFFESPAGRPFRIIGYVDRLKQHTQSGRIFIDESKTMKQARWWTLDEILMDPQQSLYAAVLKYSMNVDVFGIMFTQFNTYEYKKWQETPVDKLFHREQTGRTDAELKNILHNTGLLVDDILDKREKGVSPEELPRTLTRDCKRCWFKGPCLMNLKGIPLETALEANYEKKPPYIENEEEEVEREEVVIF